MLIDDDSQEFAKILDRDRRHGELREFSGKNERRKFPRLQVNSDDLWIDSIVQFSVLNMSPSGVALRCNHPVQLGELLHLSLGPLQGAQAEVVSCELEESPTEHLDAQYQVRCRFLNVKDGMKLVIKTRQLNEQASQ